MNMEFFDKAAECLPAECFERAPDLGIVLGSGWGAALAADEVLARVKYQDIAGLGATGVVGHAGEFILFRKSDKLIAAWCGRRHYYEGVGWEPVVLPVEMLRRMGCRDLLLTNAAGGINRDLRVGDFVIIRDHLNFAGVNPLVGKHRQEWGSAFPDMTEVYCAHHAALLHDCAGRLGIRALDGVYGFASGPCYETPAEIRAYAMLGADVIGMSTVPEAVLAKACGMNIAAISLVSNQAAGIAPVPLSHQEVVAAGEDAKSRMAALIGDFIARL